MSKLNETKCNKKWIPQIHRKFNKMKKVMLGNAKIKEISNFAKLKNSENILCYQKPVMLLMKWTLGKNILQNYLFWTIVHQRRFNPIYQVPFAKFCSGQIRHFLNKFAIFHFQLFPKFFTKSVLVFLKNFRPFKKHGIALLVSRNQYCHTEPL